MIAARQLRGPTAEGLALLRKSFVALYGERDPRAGHALTVQTAETTAGTSHVLTGLATLHAAEAHAMLGQRRPYEQALTRAETQFNRIDPSDAAFEFFSPTQFGRLAGSCIRQRNLEEATARLHEAIVYDRLLSLMTAA